MLFDEIEKAHPDVFNILLQVLDDGRLTDSKGRTVNFKNTIIIMTSNLGSQLIQGNTNHEAAVRQVTDLLKKTIRPEFLNRIDEIVVFKPLTQGEIKQVVRLQIAGIQKMLEQNGIQLKLQEDAVELLAEEGYDPDFGARPVKRAIQRLLLNDLSKELLGTSLDKNRPIIVRRNGNLLAFSN